MSRTTEPGRKEAIAEQFLSGKPVKAIAYEYHLTPNAIYAMLNRMGVSVRGENKVMMTAKRQMVAEYYDAHHRRGNAEEIARQFGLTLPTLKKFLYDRKQAKKQ